MTAAKDRSDRTVRITVKVRPDEYDKLCRHVRHLGSNLSAFFRESADKAMREKDGASLAALSSIHHDAGVATEAAREARREYRNRSKGSAERKTNHGKLIRNSGQCA
jgi:hypothetical protein